MYNFFANRINKKAFMQALKEVEKEGYFVSQDLSEDVVFTTNMSRAVAALSDDQISVRPAQDKTLDVSGYNPNLDTERIKPASADVLQEKVYTKQSRARMYEKMFSDEALLSGEHIKERGLLSNETDQDDTILLKRTAKKSRSDSEDLKTRTKTLLADLNRRAEELSREKAAQKQEQQLEEPVEEEIEETQEFDVEEPVQEKAVEEPVQEEPVQEEPQQVVPEIIAAVESEPAIEEQSTIVPVMQAQGKQSTAAPKKPKAQSKPKTQRTRKKRRRYDADIAGGFDF